MPRYQTIIIIEVIKTIIILIIKIVNNYTILKIIFKSGSGVKVN